MSSDKDFGMSRNKSDRFRMNFNLKFVPGRFLHEKNREFVS